MPRALEGGLMRAGRRGCQASLVRHGRAAGAHGIYWRHDENPRGSDRKGSRSCRMIARPMWPRWPTCASTSQRPAAARSSYPTNTVQQCSKASDKPSAASSSATRRWQRSGRSAGCEAAVCATCASRHLSNSRHIPAPQWQSFGRFAASPDCWRSTLAARPISQGFGLPDPSHRVGDEELTAAHVRNGHRAAAGVEVIGR